MKQLVLKMSAFFQMVLVMVRIIFCWSDSQKKIKNNLDTQFSDQFYCMYCPTNGIGCTVVPGLDEGACATSYACELPDGEVVFDLNEEECRFVKYPSISFSFLPNSFLQI